MMSDNAQSYPLILVVEDDSNHAELLERAFEDAAERFTLVFVTTLREADHILETHSVALVLTDYRLPDGAGNELVTMVRNRCPVIVMTSYGNEHIAAESIKTGAFDYVVKSPVAFQAMPYTAISAIQSFSLIVARRQADAAALRAKRDWERTFDAVPDLIALLDKNHIICRANRSMIDFFGNDSQAIVGRSCCQVVHGFEYSLENCPTAVLFSTINSSRFEIKVMKDGSEHFFEVSVFPLEDDSEIIPGYVHVMHNITERKKAEENHRAMEQHLQHTQRLESLGVLAGGIAHDFNNILTIILGNSFALKECTVSEEERKFHLDQIESAAKRAADLCRKMLEYAGSHPVARSQFSLRQLVAENIRMLSAAIKKNVEISLDLGSDTLPLFADISQMQQVIMNVIINAAEAIGDQNGVISVRLHTISILDNSLQEDYFGKVIPAGNYAILDVSDTGCGMDEETRKKIFEPFFTTKFAGRGLGMSSILGIIKSHDGVLQLESIPGKGTTISVYLPLHPSSSDMISEAVVDSAEVSARKATILLVEDEVDLLVMSKMLLESLGFTVMTAENGKEALEIHNRYGDMIDAVIVDLIMPVMGGIAVYKHLRAFNPALPILICSGYGGETVKNEIFEDQRCEFVHKPYNPLSLRLIVQNMLGQSL